MNPLALVTGAGTGIGRALSQRLIARGCDVLAIGRRTVPLESLAADHPGRVTTLPLDIAADDAPRRILAALGDQTLRFVVHNAATLEPAGPLAQLDRAAFRAHLETNLTAPLFVTQALLPHMEPGARVLHVSSGAAHHALSGWGPYCMSKAALHMLTQCWNAERKDHGVLVGSARPGVVDTPMQATIRDLTPEAFPDVESFRRLKSDGALLPPETVARFLAWMLLDADDEQFSAAERDIRDSTLAKQWSR
jgi:benzil reductase ((S)-benzoin forming)